jgi:hypothetical protein
MWGVRHGHHLNDVEFWSILAYDPNADADADRVGSMLPCANNNSCLAESKYSVRDDTPGLTAAN